MAEDGCVDQPLLDAFPMFEKLGFRNVGVFGVGGFLRSIVPIYPKEPGS